MSHDGQIVTDATSCWTAEGVGTIFLAIDHCTASASAFMPLATAPASKRWEPIRQGVREQFGGYEGDRGGAQPAARPPAASS